MDHEYQSYGVIYAELGAGTWGLGAGESDFMLVPIILLFSMHSCR